MMIFRSGETMMQAGYKIMITGRLLQSSPVWLAESLVYFDSKKMNEFIISLNFDRLSCEHSIIDAC